MKKGFLIVLMIFSLTFVSCDTVFHIVTDTIGDSSTSSKEPSKPEEDNTKPNQKPSSFSLKESVYERAKYYTTCNTVYESGAMGRSSAIPFDCSGFVIRCYQDILKGTSSHLPFSGHPTANDLMTKYTVKTNNPERGDLIFLNFNRNSSTKATHVGIFVGYEGNKIKFIDASDYEGYSKVVDFRKVTIGDKAILGFGVMKISR